MKRLLVSLIILICSCSTQRDLVESQFNYKGSFGEYKTFGFVNDISGIQNGLNGYEDMLIENIIYKRFTAMGYSFDSNSPDLLITFRYFREGTSLVTSSQESLKNWITSVNHTEDDRYALRRKTNKNGTLSIFFIDRETSKVVFQGYNKDYQQDYADYQIVSSIGQILDSYQVTNY